MRGHAQHRGGIVSRLTGKVRRLRLTFLARSPHFLLSPACRFGQLAQALERERNLALGPKESGRGPDAMNSQTSLK